MQSRRLSDRTFKQQWTTAVLYLVLVFASMTSATAATSDLVAFGGAGWATQPVAFSNGNGLFSVTNYGIANFATWAATPGVQVVTGDFNGMAEPIWRPLA